MQGQVRKPGKEWYVQYRWEPKSKVKSDGVGDNLSEDPADQIEPEVMNDLARTLFFENKDGFDTTLESLIKDKVEAISGKVNAHMESFEMTDNNCQVKFRSKKQAENAFRAIKKEKDDEIDKIGRLVLPKLFF